jgi:hypothetical protein
MDLSPEQKDKHFKLWLEDATPVDFAELQEFAEETGQSLFLAWWEMIQRGLEAQEGETRH